MCSFDFWSALGFTNNALMMMETFGGSSRIILTDNPDYTLEMFRLAFPVFRIQDDPSAEVDRTSDNSNSNSDDYDLPFYLFNLFRSMANASIKYDRYPNIWEYAMGLYIAHYLALALQTSQGDPSAAAVLAGAMPKGIATSKSVDGLSISYDMMDLASDMEGYGTFKYTMFGMQLVTLIRPYGHGGMWVV